MKDDKDALLDCVWSIEEQVAALSDSKKSAKIQKQLEGLYYALSLKLKGDGRHVFLTSDRVENAFKNSSRNKHISILNIAWMDFIEIKIGWDIKLPARCAWESRQKGR